MAESCKICNNDNNNRIYSLREMMFGTRHLFDYLECSRCGTIQLLNPPDDLNAYYPDDYYAYTTLNRSGKLRNILKRIRWKLYGYFDIKPFRPLYGDWLKRANVKLEDKIADIGCGNGQILYEMCASGFKNLVGIDPLIEESEYINPSLALLKKNIYEIEDTFDFIMMHHSFEHMDKPQKVLQKINELLKPGKQLLIRIPISDGEAWETYGVNWVQLDPPRHIFVHSIKSIQLLAAQTGFEITQIIHDSTAFQFWASEAIRNDIPTTKAQATLTKNELNQYNKQAQQLNREGKGDQACFYLRKIKN